MSLSCHCSVICSSKNISVSVYLLNSPLIILIKHLKTSNNEFSWLMVFAVAAGTTLTSGRPSQPVTRRWTQLWLNCRGWVRTQQQCGWEYTDLCWLSCLCFQNYSGELNYLVALHELYKYINKYYDQVCLCSGREACLVYFFEKYHSPECKFLHAWIRRIIILYSRIGVYKEEEMDSS